jgi:hypothetical protein
MLVYFFRWYLKKGSESDAEALMDRDGEPSSGADAAEEEGESPTGLQLEHFDRARDDRRQPGGHSGSDTKRNDDQTQGHGTENGDKTPDTETHTHVNKS